MLEILKQLKAAIEAPQKGSERMAALAEAQKLIEQAEGLKAANEEGAADA